MLSNYDLWNNCKKKISNRNSKPPYFKQRDIWWVSIGYNIGCEIYGKGPEFVRPVLILRKFNRYSFIGIPLSTKIKENKYYIEITLNKKVVSALISQIRTFSSRRINNKMGVLNIQDYIKVIKEVTGLFKLPPPKNRGSRG